MGIHELFLTERELRKMFGTLSIMFSPLVIGIILCMITRWLSISF